MAGLLKFAAENWELIAGASGIGTGFIIGAFRKIFPKKVQAEAGISDYLMMTSYDHFEPCANDETHSFISSVYQVYLEGFRDILRKEGRTEQEIQSSSRLRAFKTALSNACHRRLMPAVLEAIYDNGIPDVPQSLSTTITHYGISSFTHMDEATKWYYERYLKFTSEVDSHIKDYWTDLHVTSADYLCSIFNLVDKDMAHELILMFDSVRSKRDRVIRSTIKKARISEAEYERRYDEFIDEFTTYWGGKYSKSGRSQLLRG